MYNAVIAEALLGKTPYAVTFVRPDGQIVYCNESACEQLGLPRNVRDRSLLQILTLPFRWMELVEKLKDGEPTVDEPVLVRTENSEAETCYLTSIPEFSVRGELLWIICVWSSRKYVLSATDDDKIDDPEKYTRDLEAIIEHRTYKHLLLAEQNQAAREVLDALAVGIIVASLSGDIEYINRAMTDDFGLRPANYLKPNIRYCLRPDLVEIFDRVAVSGLRHWARSVDPEQKPVGVDYLPLGRRGEIQRIALQFARIAYTVESSPERVVE